MAKLFAENGGKLHMNSRLVSLKQTRLDGIDLIQLFYRQSDQTMKSCYAKQLILAMPRKSIEMLDKESFIFANKQFVEDLGRVTPKPSSKIFIWYDQEWWGSLGLFSGPSRTDLPIRQCYYVPAGSNQEVVEDSLNSPSTRKGLLMASYTTSVSIGASSG